MQIKATPFIEAYGNLSINNFHYDIPSNLKLALNPSMIHPTKRKDKLKKNVSEGRYCFGIVISFVCKRIK